MGFYSSLCPKKRKRGCSHTYTHIQPSPPNTHTHTRQVAEGDSIRGERNVPSPASSPTTRFVLKTFAPQQASFRAPLFSALTQRPADPHQLCSTFQILLPLPPAPPDSWHSSPSIAQGRSWFSAVEREAMCTVRNFTFFTRRQDPD